MDLSPAYNTPHIQRKQIIPLAREFVLVASDRSSVDDFIEFIVKRGSVIGCNRRNMKNWKKDAFKSLRLANAELLSKSPTTESITGVSVPDHYFSDVNVGELDSSGAHRSRKRPKVSSDIQPVDFYYLRTPTSRLSQLASTTPSAIRRRLKCFLQYHLRQTASLPIWPSVLINGPPFCGKTTLIEAACGSLGVKIITVSVGTVPANIRSWIEVFNQAKISSPCILHLDDIESMEKHSTPIGTFRITCLLKSQLLKELIGSGVVVVGETRSLLASLPQSVVDLFTQRITFGMLDEKCRLGLFKQFLSDDLPEEFRIVKSPQPALLHLTDGLTCAELARRTPGYEAGDIVRFVAQLRVMSTLDSCDSDSEENLDKMTLSFEEPEGDVNHCGQDPVSSAPVFVSRELVDQCLSLVVPAAKSSADFVTIPDVTWADVGGLDSTRTHLYNRFMLLVEDWERAQALHRRSGGVLLEGPPGCGKTLVAKALSNQAGLNFLSVKGPEILNKFQGESERRVREIFERARACQPCLIFFDEIDAICPKRDGDEATGSRVSIVNQLLVELDGVDRHRSGRVFVVGATNRKDMIDPAILRPGRLGLHLVISPPVSVSDRASVLSACTRGATTPIVEGGMQSLSDLAADSRTEGMSGADLDNLLELAKLGAQLDKQDFISRKHLFNALNELYNECPKSKRK